MKTCPPTLGFLLLALAATSQNLDAQIFTKGRVGIEPRIGIAFPLGDFGNADPSCPVGATGCDYPDQTGVEPGRRWDVRVHYFLTDRVTLVAGYGRTKFGCSGPFCGSAPDPEAQAFDLGVRTVAGSLGSMDIWVEGGGSMEKFSIIRTRNESGEPESKRVWYPWSLGFFVGGGAELPLTGEGNFYFSPGFQYHHATADPPSSQPNLQSVTAQSLTAQIGFKLLLERD
jgi:hypothetical protein